MCDIMVKKGDKAIYNNAGDMLLTSVMQKSGIFSGIPGYIRGKRGPVPYTNADIALVLATSLGTGNPDFTDVEAFAEAPEFFGTIFGTDSVPSESTIRQRTNDLAARMARNNFAPLSDNIGGMVTALGLKPTPMSCGRVPVRSMIMRSTPGAMPA